MFLFLSSKTRSLLTKAKSEVLDYILAKKKFETTAKKSFKSVLHISLITKMHVN